MLKDIEYALFSQVSYLDWQGIFSTDNKKIIDIIDNPRDWKILKINNIPEPVIKDGEPIYYGEDKRLLLTYGLINLELEEGKRTEPIFKNLFKDWEFLYAADGKKLVKDFLKFNNAKHDSGFFACAFQKGKDIMIAFRGTEFTQINDWLTNFDIYIEKFDSMVIEAFMFYEYIKVNYGKGCNIHITGHSLGGGLSQFTSVYSGNKHTTKTWNGLGVEKNTFNKLFTSLMSQYLEVNLVRIGVTSGVRGHLLSIKEYLTNLEEKKYLEAKEKLLNLYNGTHNMNLEIFSGGNITNYFMSMDTVPIIKNTIGKSVVVDQDTPGNPLKKLSSAHGINDFLIFIDDEGNITKWKTREEFSRNSLKTLFKEKADRMVTEGTLSKSGDKYEITEEKLKKFNMKEHFNRFTSLFLAKSSWNFRFLAPVKENIKLIKDEGYEKIYYEKDAAENGKYIGEIRIGKYNNINELGNILGSEPMKVYILKEDNNTEEETISENDKVKKKAIKKVIYGGRMR